MKYALFAFALLTIASITYAINIETDPNKIIEKKNRENIIKCLEDVQSKTGSLDMKKQMKTCVNLPLLNIWTGNTAQSSGVPWYNKCKIGTWSTDVRYMAKNYPWVAWWKNNNPSWITLGSKKLEKDFDESGIKWYVWTPRPAKEWSNYYWFPDLENGMRAKLLIIKRSYKNSTVSQYLRILGTDSIKTNIDTSRTIDDLSDN